MKHCVDYFFCIMPISFKIVNNRFYVVDMLSNLTTYICKLQLRIIIIIKRVDLKKLSIIKLILFDVNIGPNDSPNKRLLNNLKNKFYRASKKV